MLCLRPLQLNPKNASNSMSSTTPRRRRSSSAPNAVNRRVQLEVQRYVPEEFLPVWGVLFSQRGSYISANGPSEFGLISYAEGEGIYQVEPPPGSPLPLVPVPLPTATTANSEQSASIPAAQAHEQPLPLLVPDISAAAHHVSPNYVLMDPQYQYTLPAVTHPYLQSAWQCYPPGGLIPRDFDVYGHQITCPGSVLGDASPSANLWAGLPATGHGYGGFPTPSDVDGHQSTRGSVLPVDDMSSDANSWNNSPFTGHASPNGSFVACSPSCSPSYSPHVHNNASPGSLSGSPSSTPSQNVQEDFIYATQGAYLEPRATTSIRPNGGTFLS